MGGKGARLVGLARRRLRAMWGAAACAMVIASAMPAAGEEAPAGLAKPLRGLMGPPAPLYSAAGEEDALPPAILFNTELEGLMAEAVARHPSIASRHASLRAAGVDITSAWLTRLPTMSIQANQYGSIAMSQTVAASIDMPLWTNGRISATIARAHANQQVETWRLAETVLDVQMQVNQYYHEVKRQAEREQVLTRTLGVMDDMVASMQRRVDQEVSPQADLQLVQSRRLQVQQQRDLTMAQRASALAHLRDLVLRDDIVLGPDWIAPARWPQWQSDRLIQQGLTVSPQRRRVIAEAKVSEEDAKVAAAARLPSLYGSYSYDEVYHHRLGISLRMQTNGGFSEIFIAHAAKLREKASELQVPTTEQDLKATLSADLVEYTSARARQDGAQDLAKASERITESYVRQFVSGRRTWLDVMNAVREAMSAELDAIDVRYSAASSANRLLLRTGNLQETTEGSKK